jgi:catechol 2,3-dioxygenase-like lactoylglutathione lyase family enzyme
MQPTISRIAFYVRDIPKIAAFYQRHFGFEPDAANGDFVQLLSPTGGCALVLLQAGKGQKPGQSNVKIVFDVPDLKAFIARCAADGLKFSTIHQADGYQYANARDTAGNPIQISNRCFRK